MKRYYLNSKLAKWLLFPSCHTIAIGWLVFSKKSEISDKTKVHETIHAMQWTEVTIMSMFLLALVSPWWMLASPLVYYVWYVLEWLMRLPRGNAYRSILFEREAFEHDEDIEYLINRELFAWLR